MMGRVQEPKTCPLSQIVSVGFEVTGTETRQYTEEQAIDLNFHSRSLATLVQDTHFCYLLDA